MLRAGDEDNGEMGAWYVLSALGLFSTTPGTPDYVLNTPLFKHTIVRRQVDEGGDFHIIASGADMQSIHTEKVYLDGKDVTVSPVLSDHEIKGGRVLQFVTSDEAAPKIESIEGARASSKSDGVFEAELKKQEATITDLQSQLSALRKHSAEPAVATEPMRSQSLPHNNLEPQYEKLRRGE